jgi:hypothetical protein
MKHLIFFPHSISRPVIDPLFRNFLSDRLYISRISCSHYSDSDESADTCPDILYPIDPSSARGSSFTLVPVDGGGRLQDGGG